MSHTLLDVRIVHGSKGVSELLVGLIERSERRLTHAAVGGHKIRNVARIGELNLLALGIGFGTSTLLKTPYKDRRTITIETGIQNSGLGLALLLNPNIFDPAVWSNNGGMLIITAWWGVWHIVSGLSLAGIWRLNGRKEVTE